ncbi:hypothetical protein [Nonomuraea sp. B5E05]|uniref:hypothetical protein n=1 Tax=Nonomuraea sp. B5E05 TaxID=3153569 RepID=UPI0032611E6B
MEKAAGVSSITFTCHFDTWGFIYKHAHEAGNFNGPKVVDEQPDGFVAVPVSGPTLVAVLETLWREQRNKYRSAGNRAIAKRIYDVTSTTVEAIDLEAAERGTPIPPVVIDAKHGTADPQP